MLNKILHGDCLEIMKDIPDKSIDMILCDLPYGTTNCKWDTIIQFEPLWEQYNRIIKDKGGAIVLTASEPFTSALVMSNPKSFREKLTWIKHKASNFMAAKYMHLKYTEDIVVFGNAGITYNKQMVPRKSPRIKEMAKNNLSRTIKDVSEVSLGTILKPKPYSEYDPDFKNPMDYIEIPAIAGNAKEKTKHPTQKPVALFEYLIKTYTNEGETVLDNCIGSGTTAIAALNLDRNFIGIEQEKEYVDIANKRIEEHKLQLV